MGRSRKRNIPNEIVEGLTEFTETLESSDKIPETFTVRTVKLNLEPTQPGPEDVLLARQLLGASQGVFAAFLGVRVKTVQSWEQGVNPVKGTAARVIDEIKHNPDMWRQRLKELATGTPEPA